MKTRNQLLYNGLRAFLGPVAALALLAAGPAAHAGDLKNLFFGKGKELSETYQLKDFDAIRVNGVYELQVQVGQPFAVTISGSGGDLKDVHASVEGHVLVLDQNSHHWFGFHKHGVSARISLPSLDALDVTGVGDAEISNISSDKFHANISGVGDVDLSGSCRQLVARVSGIGDFDARKFECKSVSVRVSGIGDATVYASDDADVKASGIGDINVYGSPAVVVKHGQFLSEVSIH